MKGHTNPQPEGAGDPPPPSTFDLYATGFNGIEATAPLIEIRLALAEWRERHGPDAWRIHMPAVGRA